MWRVVALGSAALGLLAAGATLAEGSAELRQRGRALYDGTLPGFAARVHDTRDASIQLPAAQGACASCHRPSGLGSFEGTVAVPPIAGDVLFRPYDAATTHRYAWASTLRERPAYSEESLRTLLRTGRTPDGRTLSVVMPRYDVSEQDAAALAAHLRTLSGAMAPGVSADAVHFATVTTPDVPAAQVDRLLATLTRFFEHKNANTRAESSRRASALRNEQTMYRRHRTWHLHHWALTGPPQGWAGQLAAYEARQPVFAMLSGLGGQTWEPVHRFCAERRMPCLLPTVALPPQDEDFYSVYLSRALPGQATAAARHLAAATPAPASVRVLAGESASERAQAQAIAAVLAQHGLPVQLAAEWRAGATVVSALPSAEVERRRLGPAGASTMILLAGLTPVAPEAVAADARGAGPSWWVTDQLHGSAAERQLQRANAWLRANGLATAGAPADVNGVVARNALLAGSVAVESLMHVDENFSREYCLEKLEHTLENLPALTAYPRLALGPGQRFAAKQVMLLPMPPGP